MTTEVQPTIAELTAKVIELGQAGNIKELLKTAAILSKMQADVEKSEFAAKLAALVEVELKVKSAVKGAIQEFIDSGELNEADGVFFTWDFDEAESNAVNIKLLKGTIAAPRKASSAGGGGVAKKFPDYDTKTDGVDKHADELIDADFTYTNEAGVKVSAKGMTYSDAYKASTNGNWRYQIRMALLKLDGLIK